MKMNTRLDFNFPVPTKLYFGVGKLGMLHTLEMPGKKALVVSLLPSPVMTRSASAMAVSKSAISRMMSIPGFKVA